MVPQRTWKWKQRTERNCDEIVQQWKPAPPPKGSGNVGGSLKLFTAFLKFV